MKHKIIAGAAIFLFLFVSYSYYVFNAEKFMHDKETIVLGQKEFLMGSSFSLGQAEETTLTVMSFNVEMGEESAVDNAAWHWWNQSWLCRVPITIHERSGQTLVDFQVLIVVDTATLISAGKMKPDGGDIKFIYDNNNDLIEISYWVESGINTSRTRIWIKVPKIPMQGAVIVHMYYNNPRAESKSNFDETFTKDYGGEGLVGAWHFDEGSGGMVVDSSGNGNDGMTHGASWTDLDGGQWDGRRDVKFSTGSSLSFDGIDDYVKIPHSESLNQSDCFSIAGWLKFEEGWGTGVFQVDGVEVGSKPIEAGRWYYMVSTWDGFTARVYVNGALDNEHSKDDPNRVNREYSQTFWCWSHSLYIGCGENTRDGKLYAFLHGTVDEFRVYNRALSAGEVKCYYEWRKYADPEPIISIGEEETTVLRATIDIDPNTLNLQSQGRWITCYIELPTGYFIENIDPNSILLDGRIQAEPAIGAWGDYDQDGIPNLMVKFDRSAMQALVSVGEVELTVTGMVNGIPFEGSDNIRVIDSGKTGNRKDESEAGSEGRHRANPSENRQLPDRPNDSKRRERQGGGDDGSRAAGPNHNDDSGHGSDLDHP